MKKLILGIIFCSLGAAAADVYDLPKPSAVMNRKFNPKSDVTLNMGYLPVGAFSKYFAAGMSYLMPFNENHGWEILNATYAMEQKTALKSDIKLPPYNAVDEDLPVLKYLVTTNYIFSPLYTKSLLFNSTMIFTQTSFVFGGGVGQYSTGAVPTVDVGIIERLFIGPNSSLKFDFRYFTFITNKESIKNNITLMLGWAYNFGD